MANLSKLKKRRNTLGAPPPLEEASQNLNAPEIAPVHRDNITDQAVVPDARTHGHGLATSPPTGEPARIDGRTLRKTGRTLQLATRVSWDFDDRLRRIAQREQRKLVEVLERALDAYEKMELEDS